MEGVPIFFSIRHRHVRKIFEGVKTVELRRVRPKYITRGTLAFIYVPSPVRSLVGTFEVNYVVKHSVKVLWERVQDSVGLNRDEFDSYFEGKSEGVAIFLRNVKPLDDPIELSKLRKITGFQPPQSFRYARSNELSTLEFADLIETIG